MKYVALAALVGGVLYLPVRREILDRGWIPAAEFSARKEGRLILWDTGRYRLGQQTGKFAIERFPDAPWISLLELDSGLRLHVHYEDRVYRVEDIPEMGSADDRFVRR